MRLLQHRSPPLPGTAAEKEELYAGIGKDGQFTPIPGKGKEVSKGYEGNFDVDLSKTDAICHSHPKGSGYSPIPGWGDDGVVKLGVPNYIIRDGVYGVLEMSDGQYQYRLLKGKLEPAHKKMIRQELNKLQNNL